MVEFGKQLVESQHEPWANAYLDYKGLKAALKQIGKQQPTDPETSSSIVLLEEAFAGDFELLIDNQIEKVVLFFLEKQGNIASRLNDLRHARTSSVHSSTGDFDPKVQSQEYLQLGEELVLLVNFVELNVTGLRKILKKHDKKFHKFPIMERYLSHYNVHGNDSHLQQMYHYGGIAALVETLRRGLEDLMEIEASLQQEVTVSTTKYATISSVQQVKPILDKIHAARQRLKQSTTYAQSMANQALIFDDLSDEAESITLSIPSGSRRNEEKRRRQISGYINLMSTFLYMTNYYIVAPTSGDYAARLGMSEAWSGVIIGMTPCAAMVASILYSWWSNHSYKNALLFAACCSVVGDILYALALPFNSVPLIIIGRLLNGFGGARAINRRYIADAFSRNERTAASASFVTAGALGMAVGPALAVAADVFTPEQDPTKFYWWTVETAPGWIMFVLWVSFLIIAFLYFEEPPRRGSTKVTEMAIHHHMSEEQPLVGNGTVDTETKQVHHERPFYKNVAVMTTLGIYFVLKLVLECLLSSTATITSFYFDWNVTRTGLLLAILGLLMFPANMVVAILSRRYQDREIIIATEVIILVGTISIIAYSGDNYTPLQYIVASVCCFLGTNMLEAPNMSLLSKTIPRSMAKGIFNSGLLATEAGTFGRVVGDFVISAAGLVGLERILDLTFTPIAVLVFFTLVATWKLYPHLEPDDDEDD
mmetsp:Transcript_11358/g.18796  ORF Transcript_11358/g.18796 Transcript_11358/m.18796 type:complete len:709 (-) Transcript_11358:295-2421(-)